MVAVCIEKLLEILVGLHKSLSILEGVLRVHVVVSGTVAEVNEALEDHPELINQDAFANWIMKVNLSDKAELDSLMDAAAYEKYCQSL